MEDNFKLQYTQVAGGLEWYKREPLTHKPITDMTNQGITDIMNWETQGNTDRIERGIDYFQDRMTNLYDLLYEVMHGGVTFVDILDANGNLVGKTYRRGSSNISFAAIEPPAQYDEVLKDWNYKKLVILNIEDCGSDKDSDFKLVKNLLFYGDRPDDVTLQDLDLYIIIILEQVILSGPEVKGDSDDFKVILEKVIKKAIEKIRDKVIEKVIKYFEKMALEYAELEGEMMILGGIAGVLIYLFFDYILYIVSKLFLPEYSQTTLYLNESKYPFEAYLAYGNNLNYDSLPSQWKAGAPLLIDAAGIATSFNSHQMAAKTNLKLYEALTLGFSIICYSGEGGWPIERMKQVTSFQPPKELKEKLNFSNFISFSRYLDPGISQQIPPAIVVAFDVENAKDFAENFSDSKMSDLSCTKKLSDGNTLTIHTELHHLPNPEDDPNQRVFYQACLFRDEVMDDIIWNFAREKHNNR